MTEFERTLGDDYPWLPRAQIHRYVRTYGTLSRCLLGDAQSIDDLGKCFGADLYAKEIDFLMDIEWAMSAEDIVWRRTKLGLRLNALEIENVETYAAANAGKVREKIQAGKSSVHFAR